jgi:hypothetical protein
MFNQKSAAIVITSVIFSFVEILASQQLSHALGVQVEVKCTAPVIVFGNFTQQCTEYKYAPDGGIGNGNGNNNGNNNGNSGKGTTTRTGGGSYRIIGVRKFQRKWRAY